MFGGFITGEVSENKHRHANRKDAQHDRSLSDSIINDKSLTRAEKLAMWKKVKGQRSRRDTNPPAPQAKETNDANNLPEGRMIRTALVLFLLTLMQWQSHNQTS